MTGIIELPEDAPVGTPFAAYAGLDDPVFDVAVTPNRPDCMGVAALRAISRQRASGTLKPLAVPQIEGSFPCPVPVAIEDPDGLPGFLRPGDPRADERRLARLDAAAAEGRRTAADLGAGRHHQLRDASTTAGRRTPTTSPS